jgi:hypothetical protein
MSNKTKLINDLMSTTTVMEEIWRYHPTNPNKVDIVKAYSILESIKAGIENELDGIEK